MASNAALYKNNVCHSLRPCHFVSDSNKAGAGYGEKQIQCDNKQCRGLPSIVCDPVSLHSSHFI